MTKLKESYKWSGVWQEKGLALVPKKTRVDWSAARKMGVALVPQYMGMGCGKFYWFGPGLGRAEQHCTLVQQPSVPLILF